MAGRGRREVLSLVSFLCPAPPHPNVLFGHKIKHPKFSNPLALNLGQLVSG